MGGAGHDDRLLCIDPMEEDIHKAAPFFGEPYYADALDFSREWRSGGRALSTRDRIIIGLIVALFELLGIMLLFMAFSSTVVPPKAFGSGQGLLLFAPFSGENEQAAKDSAAARKAANINTTPPAHHVKSQRADKHPDPPIPLASKGDPEKRVQDSADTLPDKGTSTMALGTPDSTDTGTQNGTVSTGGGANYDPYAGASPQYRSVNEPSGPADQRLTPLAMALAVSAWLSGAVHSDQDIAVGFVEKLRTDILTYNPHAKGSITFNVLVDVSGLIREVRIDKNTIPNEIGNRARQMLIGRKINGLAMGWRLLPTLQF